jgi:hypothetical protein
MNWVLKAVEGRMLAPVAPEEVRVVEVDELGTYVEGKKRTAGCGGQVIVLPRRSADGCWAIVEPKRSGAWMRTFLRSGTSATAPISGLPMASSLKSATFDKARRTLL